ncbi:hypothetical protein GCM10010387_66690 [Streptomyces inusitatus]|uniref:Uncharacterized protein n=1 Tax=Streptomyces inusitatus TaxID=68221 RepID=A0A918V4M8_9ACTN|nr:hypothetical protein GCM10010387_66690 [Streptomyces inusitatus]
MHHLTGYVLIVRETGFPHAHDQGDPGEALPYPPVWEVQGRGTVTRAGPRAAGPGGGGPTWFDVRLTFADGARIDVLAVVEDGRIAIEDLCAEPPLTLPGFSALARLIETPLADACRTAATAPEPVQPEQPVPLALVPAEEPSVPAAGHRRPRPGRLRGRTVRRIAADAYRAAQRDGADPVLAVMGATGRSRRKSLRLISGARDEGYLAPRHHRR